MNERIKELADKAQEYAEYTTPQGLEWFPIFKEKFAELIVKECAKQADELPGDYLLQPYKYPSTWIKERFGVK